MTVLKKYNIGNGLLLLMAIPLVASCSLYAESSLTPHRVQVQEEKFSQEIPLKDLNEASVSGLAQHYSRFGDGPVALTVTYDPKSSSSTAMKASSELSRIMQLLKRRGVQDIQGNIMPVNGQGENALVVISYASYTALAPQDCELMDGVKNSEMKINKDYKLGCTVDTLFARQIARPKDLRGNGQEESPDGRRASNIVETYRTGVQNEPLEGESASE